MNLLHVYQQISGACICLVHLVHLWSTSVLYAVNGLFSRPIVRQITE